MPDIAASVLARLKNKATQSGRSFQLCLQLFCQEEFLRRLEKSKYADNFVLKGGLLIYAITNFESRVTIDIDFLLLKLPNTPQQLKETLDEIINCESENDFITFELKSVEPITVTKKYTGVSASITARIKNTRIQLKIDIGVGDIIIPRKQKQKVPTQLEDFTAPNINAYSIETTIAEKLDAILTLMEFSSRMKDYYDIYYLANHFNFEGNILVKALKNTFKNRNHSFTNEHFEQIMSFYTNEAMQKKWKAFSKKVKIEVDNFKTVIDTIRAFLEQPYTAVMQNKQYKTHWVASEQTWKTPPGLKGIGEDS
ncbi:MAG: nucleotidyl transferase AbiEii/AbiGii toxin family protein [Candidatus Riflebacteria bacterium]|nr:nucleotidyl transferase AbiEii/AbiGii toxin family protein [Candidatus Riflebacteria bacterium]